VSGDPRKNFCERIEHVKVSKKVLYHFAKFGIVNELLIIEDRRISARDKIGLSDAFFERCYIDSQSVSV